MTDSQPLAHPNDRHGIVALLREENAILHRLKSDADGELERLRQYREIMESAHGARLYAISRLLEHFDAQGNLRGDGRWRLAEIYKCCREIDDASQAAAVLFDAAQVEKSTEADAC